MMRIMRRYLCSYDTGHDYGSFTFDSTNRKGSKANLEDAKREMRRKYGKAHKIISIERYECY